MPPSRRQCVCRHGLSLLVVLALAGGGQAQTPAADLPPVPVPVTEGLTETPAPSEPAPLPSTDKPEPDKKEEEDAFRPRLRHGLSWIISHGPNRFDVIEWASRPDLFTLADLTAWPAGRKDYDLDGGLGFNVRWWAGPQGDGSRPVPNLPAQVYDLYFHGTWRQRWADWLTSEATILPGLYTDFRTTPPDAFRVPAMAVFAARLDPHLHLIAGAEYLQRNKVHVLPIAGVLWEPDDRWQWRLVFPEPKVSYQLGEKADSWIYARGEYGGGRWTIKDDFGHSDRVESSDVRVAVGFECGSMSRALSSKGHVGLGFVEVGYVFDRRLRFTNGTPTTAVPEGWTLSLGCTW